MDAHLTLRRLYKLPIARFFELLSTPRHLQAWLSPGEDIPVKVLRHEFREGGAYQLEYRDPIDGICIVVGTFIQIEAPRLISFTWEWQQHDVHAHIQTQVTWLLQEQADGTQLTVIHERMPDQSYFDRHHAGWLGALRRLETL